MAIVTNPVPTFYFIGVTTKKSSIMKVFPLWMKLFGREDVIIQGIDLRIHDSREAYRAAVAQVKSDPLTLGALVTTHKVDLFHAAEDMFDTIDPYAQITGEVSCISKFEGRLEGHAKDPISAGLSLDAITGKDYFGLTGAQVLLFGAGGSSAATILHLIRKSSSLDRPKKILVVNRSQPRLDAIRAMATGQGTEITIEYVCNADPRLNDQIMHGLPDHSIVINATGMGKDIPGSPITGAGLFPRSGIAWEFNYRGELDFLHQAQAQVQTRSLRVEDGWLYFVHGWTQVIAQVLHVNLTPELFHLLETTAAAARG